MTRYLLLALLVTLGCKKAEEATPPPPPAAPAPAPAPASKVKVDGVTGGGGAQIQVAIGGDAGDQPRLGFKITRSFEKQAITDAAPFHRDGGEWIFFEAQTDGSEPASFSFAFQSTASADSPFAFGDSILIAPDRANADKFLAQFGKAFKQTVPAHAAAPGKPLKMELAVLGRGVGKLPGGGYGGEGDWIATKLFPQLPDLEGEVFFNFSLGAKQGEIAEKDVDYNEDVMAVFAASL